MISRILFYRDFTIFHELNFTMKRGATYLWNWVASFYLYSKWDVLRPFCCDYCKGYINSYYLLPWCDTNWTGINKHHPTFPISRGLHLFFDPWTYCTPPSLRILLRGLASIPSIIRLSLPHCHSPFSSSHFSWLYSLISFANNQI